MLAFFDLSSTPGQPWKNGGGSTQELACWPPAAGMDSFAWRLSVATITRPGPFSVFPGVERQIMLLGGDGVQLLGARGRWEHRLDQRWQPFAFSGDEPVDCRIAGGPSTDLNLMLRRGLWRGALQVVHAAAEAAGASVTAPPAAAIPPAAATTSGLCMVLQGLWQWSGGHGAATRLLQAGQGLWWMDERIQPPVPASAAQPAGAALVRVALEGAACVEQDMVQDSHGRIPHEH